MQYTFIDLKSSRLIFIEDFHLLRRTYTFVALSGLLIALAGCQTSSKNTEKEEPKLELCSANNTTNKLGYSSQANVFISTDSIKALASVAKFIANEASAPTSKELLGDWTLVDLNARKSCPLEMTSDPQDKAKRTINTKSGCALSKGKAASWNLDGKELVLKSQSGGETARLVKVNKTCWASSGAAPQNTQYVLKR
ncbi:AprI/Inh family metalloprotease inhibitor [Pseudovibrio brasiliensis]|uniref:AprI/Inh family metalloprotease inhibitor n=1 Tax=Pseudovibrio brasiliensis TaxID=1898042 RepID=A0ABX8AMX3_9HYPH|nr:AprI/Inh family metalloprotease inhibitor [Pseudovibrio brasiliensis]QUS56363.1 AprI/Inh family metalloprotease inhibitor [Pseudovibrio brasiliensis]